MVSKAAKSLFALLGSLIIMFSATGCVKLDLNLTINSDSTVSGTMIFAVSDALSELSEEESTENPTDDFLDPETEGVTTEPYKKGGFTGQKITLDRVPFSEFSNGGESGDLTVSRDGDLITLNGFLDLGDETSQSAAEEDLGGLLGDAFIKSIFSSADLRIKVTFPAEVVSTTGSLSEDKRTVTWTPEFGEKLDLTTTVKVPTLDYALYAAIGLGSILLLLVLSLIVRRRKKVSSLVEPTPID